jgi:ubiquinone/menaquinone biosynthesis C-methylase UbiE
VKPRGRSKDASQRYHNRVAGQYDAMYDDIYWEFHDRLTWEAIKPFIPRDASARCCDLGCGTGKWGLKLLKSGYATTLVDHSPAMIERAGQKLAALGPKARRATLRVADMQDLSGLESDQFELILAMGDPLSICADPGRAVREMFRICRTGGVVIATADNKAAAIDYFMQRGDIDGLEQFIATGRTRWLTDEQREQFELITFTPAELQRVFERVGFTVIGIVGKTILPVRTFKRLLKDTTTFERLMRMENELSRDPTTAGRASHLQIAARKP